MIDKKLNRVKTVSIRFQTCVRRNDLFYTTLKQEQPPPSLDPFPKTKWQRSSLQAHDVDISLQYFCAAWSQGLNNEYRSIRQPWCPSPDRQAVSSLGRLRKSRSLLRTVRRFKCVTKVSSRKNSRAAPASYKDGEVMITQMTISELALSQPGHDYITRSP